MCSPFVNSVSLHTSSPVSFACRFVAESVTDEAAVGDGFFSSVLCTGSEQHLLDCQHFPADPSVCRLPYDTVGVQCREFA